MRAGHVCCRFGRAEPPASLSSGVSSVMRSPKTITIFLLAFGLWLFGGLFITSYYPAPFPVLGPDGSPKLDRDGEPLLQRDMARYFRENRAGIMLEVSSFGLLGWCMIRVMKHFYLRSHERKQTS